LGGLCAVSERLSGPGSLRPLAVSLCAVVAVPVLAGAAIPVGHIEIALLLAAAGWALSSGCRSPGGRC
jgi:hypothetical protein